MKDHDSLGVWGELMTFMTLISQLFCRMPTIGSVRYSLMIQFRLCTFGRNIIEMMLRSSHCILSVVHDFKLFIY